MAPTRPAIELGRDPGTFTNGSSFVEVSLSERYTPVRFPYSCLLGRRHYRARYGAIASALECPLAVRSPKSQRRNRQLVQIDPVRLRSRVALCVASPANKKDEGLAFAIRRWARGRLAAGRPAEHPLLHYLRSDLKPARTSSEKSCGCSQAAKCPPFSTLL